MWVLVMLLVAISSALGGLLKMPITEEMIEEFLEEHQIETADDLDDFTQFIHLLMMEPNIPLRVLN